MHQYLVIDLNFFNEIAKTYAGPVVAYIEQQQK
jgi:hypothetical protein